MSSSRSNELEKEGTREGGAEAACPFLSNEGRWGVLAAAVGTTGGVVDLLAPGEDATDVAAVLDEQPETEEEGEVVVVECEEDEEEE